MWSSEYLNEPTLISGLQSTFFRTNQIAVGRPRQFSSHVKNRLGSVLTCPRWVSSRGWECEACAHGRIHVGYMFRSQTPVPPVFYPSAWLPSFESPGLFLQIRIHFQIIYLDQRGSPNINEPLQWKDIDF